MNKSFDKQDERQGVDSVRGELCRTINGINLFRASLTKTNEGAILYSAYAINYRLPEWIVLPLTVQQYPQRPQAGFF